MVSLGRPLEGQEERTGSLTLVGAVSPPGGDFSEPVTQTSLRVAGALWALDASLAYRRHYPSVNWNRSYSLYFHDLDPWFAEHAPRGWIEDRQAAMGVMQRDAELQEVVQLVGPDALQDNERLILEIGRMIREVFLQQNAFSENDAFSSLEKTGGLLNALVTFYEGARKTLEAGIPLARVLELPIREEVARLRDIPSDAFAPRKLEVMEEAMRVLADLASRKG